MYHKRNRYEKNYLALDPGKKHTGVAISLQGALPLALETLNLPVKKQISRILKIIKDNQINHLIVGRIKNQSHSEQISFTEKYIQALKKQIPTDLKIIVFNEDFTSKLAQRLQPNKNLAHAQAAQIILQDWLKINNNMFP
ncbi:MAG: Holliday junction resolvase RuvX [Candidatus Moranbacteria bacterium]|nr:Holliday junction resolvase RuvX [Candidatus Moranbacteria bacterium]